MGGKQSSFGRFLDVLAHPLTNLVPSFDSFLSGSRRIVGGSPDSPVRERLATSLAVNSQAVTQAAATFGDYYISATTVASGVAEEAAGVQGAAAALRGTATVFEYERHASILVRFGDDVLHTEQAILQRGRQTTIVGFESGQSPLSSIVIELPDAAAALRFQRSVIGKLFGRYSRQGNSCVTHCGDVLRAGKLDGVPSTTDEIVEFLERFR